MLNVVRAVARHSHAPKFAHWKVALHILMYNRFTSSFGTIFKKGKKGGLHLALSADSNYTSEATDSRVRISIIFFFVAMTRSRGSRNDYTASPLLPYVECVGVGVAYCQFERETLKRRYSS